jgi:hypothetical protein
VAAIFAASQKGLSSMKLVYTNLITNSVHAKFVGYNLKDSYRGQMCNCFLTNMFIFYLRSKFRTPSSYGSDVIAATPKESELFGQSPSWYFINIKKKTSQRNISIMNLPHIHNSHLIRISCCSFNWKQWRTFQVYDFTPFKDLKLYGASVDSILQIGMSVVLLLIIKRTPWS